MSVSWTMLLLRDVMLAQWRHAPPFVNRLVRLVHAAGDLQEDSDEEGCGATLASVLEPSLRNRAEFADGEDYAERELLGSCADAPDDVGPWFEMGVESVAFQCDVCGFWCSVDEHSDRADEAVCNDCADRD